LPFSFKNNKKLYNKKQDMDIIVENFTKKYGAQRAVDNISFQVKTGEVFRFFRT